MTSVFMVLRKYLLANNGIILDNYYVLPICTPSLSAIMKSRYLIHTGIYSLC